MDYNLFVRHSGGFERASESAAFEARAYQAFRGAFDAQYDGGRRPLQIGMHFTLMNGGAYWRAVERLAGDVCGKPDVRCVTYAQYLAENPLPADKVAKLEPPKGGSPEDSARRRALLLQPFLVDVGQRLVVDRRPRRRAGVCRSR